MDIYDISIILVGGFVAGILNTLAGFGSIITLAIYMDVLNIPGHIANATNRVNILASSNTAAFTFYKSGKLKLGTGKKIIVLTLLGVGVGAVIASYVNEEQFKSAFKYLLILILILLLANPKRFIEVNENEKPMSLWITAPMFFLIGIYAGFIQAGYGILFLMITVMLVKYTIIKANALKISVVAIYSFFVVAWFWWQDMIEWIPGLTMAVCQSVGGFVSARYLSNIENANKWAYRLIVLIVILVIIKNFNCLDFIINKLN